ncbi:MAG: hypothetical protein H6827_00265 [Planctomycetes bacterium]|nr:hypothetical protein [Planctomycetota bacterium]
MGFNDAPGVLVIRGVENPSTYLLEHQQSTGDSDGIVLHDLDPTVKSRFVLCQNRIHTEGEASILILTSGVADSVIATNRIMGVGSAATMLGAGGDDHYLP